MSKLQEAYERDAAAFEARRRARALTAAIFATTGYYGLTLADKNVPPEHSVIPKVGAVLLMALLSLVLGSSGYDGSERYARRVAVGLTLCACGDACLEMESMEGLEVRQKKALFLGGLGAFLLGHLVYIFAFASNKYVLKLRVICPLLAYVLGVFLVLYPSLPAELVAPVFIYACAIGWMAIMACSRSAAGAHTRWSERAAAAGALIFAVSDTVLAVNRFVTPLRAAKALIMVTYFVGQAAIAISSRGAGAKLAKKLKAGSNQ